MRLLYADLFPPFSIDCDRVNIISVENGALYYKLMCELSAQCDGHDGRFVLSKDYETLNIAKVTEFMSCFIPFEVNTKKLLTKLYSKMESVCINELYDASMKLKSAVFNFMNQLCGVINSDTEFDEQTDLKNIFKCFGLKFSNSGSRISDKVIDYMLNVSEFDGKRLFVTAGLMNYMSHDEAELFFRTVTSHKLTLLMFENNIPSFGESINRMTIDEDYCVF